MRTVDYKLIYDNVLNLCGIEQDLSGVNQVAPGRVHWRLIRDLVSNRLKLGWQAARWPQVCFTELRPKELVRLTDQKAAQEEVLAILQSTPGVTQEEIDAQSDAINLTDVAIADATDQGDFIPLDQMNHTEISEVFSVRDSNPKSELDSVEIPWYLSENGIQVTTTDDNVYVFYRTNAPLLIGGLYSNLTGTNYAVGDQVYDNRAGNFYTATAEVTGDGTDKSPFVNSDDWELVEIPDVFRNYLIRGAYADYLRHNGQMEQSHPAERDAQAALDHEIGLLEVSQGQYVKYELIGTY